MSGYKSSTVSNVALCVFDEISYTDSDKIARIKYIVDCINSKICGANVEVFEFCDSGNCWENLYKVKWLKRKAEIKHKKLYDLNIGIQLSSYNSIDFVSPLNLEEYTLYFTSGIWDGYMTGISKSCFYGPSSAFDRAAEFFLSRDNKDKKMFEEQLFYWYIKTWKIKTKCANLDNLKSLSS